MLPWAKRFTTWLLRKAWEKNLSFNFTEANEFQQENFIFDLHGHQDGLIPLPMKLMGGKNFPKDVAFGELKETGVNGFVVTAIGDPNAFRIIKSDSYKSVCLQLEEIKKKIKKSGGVIALTAEQLSAHSKEKISVYVLGIEGADFLERDLQRLDEVYNQGVRLLQLVHYSLNSVGSICMGWGGKIIPPAKHTGLTSFGKEVVEKANELGMVIDLAHADEKTILDTVKISGKPVICSHTGPAALQDFPRYLSDEALKAISSTGGLIGMWPFYQGKRGMKDINTFIEYTHYVAGLIGVESVGIGTDINGVPGNMKGYKNLFDYYRLTAALLNSGFSPAETRKILGKNFLRVLNT
jgi:membrane dipeptidase